MKESRLIIIILIFLTLLVAILSSVIEELDIIMFDYVSIATNIYCGIIVGLVTSICQYCTAKRKIENNIYSYYFDIYRAYFYSKNKPILWHYNSYNIYKKIIELNSKIEESLEDYHGVLKKYDKTYKKLNPIINFGEGFKGKNIYKSILLWFNKKSFDKIFEPLMKEIEIILSNINDKKFIEDKKAMINLYNHMWNNKNNTTF